MQGRDTNTIIIYSKCSLLKYSNISTFRLFSKLKTLNINYVSSLLSKLKLLHINNWVKKFPYGVN